MCEYIQRESILTSVYLVIFHRTWGFGRGDADICNKVYSAEKRIINQNKCLGNISGPDLLLSLYKWKHVLCPVYLDLFMSVYPDGNELKWHW